MQLDGPLARSNPAIYSILHYIIFLYSIRIVASLGVRVCQGVFLHPSNPSFFVHFRTGMVAPLSLCAFKAVTQLLSLSRRNHEFEKTSRVSKRDPKKRVNTEELYFHDDHVMNTKIENIFNRHVKEKKRHEIHCLSQVLNTNILFCNIMYIGNGKSVFYFINIFSNGA